MSVIGSNVLAGASGQAVGAAGSRSLRFNPNDSPGLERSFTQAGNRQTWTFSCWVKRTTSFNSYRHTIASGPGTTLSFSESAQGGADSWFFYVDGTPYLLSNEVLRDTAAWYHVVFVFDTTNATAADRCRLYKNGVRVTSWRNTAYPAQNFEGNFNTAGTHKIGYGNSNETLDGYLADVHFVDGQALDPTDFGEYDDNNVWQPKAYSGSYGTNGFHLDFSDNSTAAALGTDSSGNSNTWTVNNLSVASGAGNDSLVDFPTNGTQTDTGVGGEVVGNYATLNPLDVNESPTIANGNLQITGTATNYHVGRPTIALTSDKWYWEATINSAIDATYYPSPGIIKTDQNVRISPYQLGGDANGIAYMANGQKYTSASLTSYGASFTQNDVIGFALDLDAGTLTCYKNGSSQGTIASGLTGSWSPSWNVYNTTSLIYNFGQRPFAYTAPSGYKALCTTNLPDPTIADGSTAMDVALYTGNGSTQTITGLGFNPDLVWIKKRNSGGYGAHYLMDALRGASTPIPILSSNSTSNEAGFDSTWRSLYGELTAFTTGGFTVVDGSSSVDDEFNGSSGTYVAWAWDAGSSTVSNSDGSITSNVRANASAGFSIVKFTNGNGTVGHGLNGAPELIITKDIDASYTWSVYSKPTTKDAYLALNSSQASGAVSGMWGSNEPTSSVFGTTFYVAPVGDELIAYCFAPVESYSSMGVYTGNGSADGPFVYTGFRPAFIMFKRTDSTGNWEMYDSARDTYNPYGLVLEANTANAEADVRSGYPADMLSNGFKLRHTGAAVNASGGSYIYLAFAENPLKYARAR